ncbi:alpha-ketoacid dehydrogenase subunit alpha/beta [Urechidicola vernalis]|uniref:3-methyl-2-oxobutanoate dehydrogenase (2-methylpropanoyl-transferring) n=1 Tax=Urechidicola vernalis TaxID=3075600 RepID=A0ABU2Y6I2_9FLAO|nr:transketolase C-terminal domain-containing protein [Urechidicola sp. P050]MDT0553804.1 transketolase C-terminal domain-containing protein [Urechidicola sp. P050]
MVSEKTSKNTEQLSFQQFREEILNDYRIAVLSRECSLLGRKEVLTGKAKFGIFGDGKEIPQLAMAKAFKKGDFRSGYYRDQTFMFALGELTPQQFFAGLYAHPDVNAEPFSAGRQMGGHFATQSIKPDGTWNNLTEQYNTSADISSTAGQMPRLLGLAQASKVYRELDTVKEHSKNFSKKGNEIAWGTIGNASTSEGLFFETFNAAGVLQVPMVISVWDDEYGISVHAKHHTTKENISEVLKGFQRDAKNKGYEIVTVKGWDYVQLIDTYNKIAELARKEHVPALIHVTEVTQPQGHSTSGSHERYKSKERLQWERDHDCNLKMREWILDFELESNGEILRFIDSEDELIAIEKAAKKEVSIAKRNAWKSYTESIDADLHEAIPYLEKAALKSSNKQFLQKTVNDLKSLHEPLRKDIFTLLRKALPFLANDTSNEKNQFLHWLKTKQRNIQEKYSSELYDDSLNATTAIEGVQPSYDETPNQVDARIVIRDNFDALFNKYPQLMTFGEDVGFIGDVNQGLEGLQAKFGAIRISDTGIREASIMGQGIGLSLRGLRPIVEIQYLDYLIYALQIMSDDIATLRYRTFGQQVAPVIIRTRGHRLEGIWHSGSPMAMMLGAFRGIHLLVPRNMTKAAGFYNTLLQANEPAVVIECLNGYRLKEDLPTNLGEFTTPLGVVETLKEGEDITIVSYGSTLRIVEQVAKDLLQVNINVEVIDVQSLLPFDIKHDIVKSLQKTNRLLIVDEDVPGGGSAYILQEVLENQNGYEYLDAKPVTLSAKAHRPAYGTDGDYYSKPNENDIFETAYKIMQEANPKAYPALI